MSAPDIDDSEDNLRNSGTTSNAVAIDVFDDAGEEERNNEKEGNNNGNNKKEDNHQKRWHMFSSCWYAFVTICYWFYRSQAPSMFTPDIFYVRLQDAVALLFVVSFAFTRKASYLVYAINPVRNCLMVALQEAIPSLQHKKVGPEFYRNIASALTQLSCAMLIYYLVKPQPIGTGTLLQEKLHCMGTDFEDKRASAKKAVTFLLTLTGLITVVLALQKQSRDFTDFDIENHGWKILFSLALGAGEEVTWRDVYMADNNNSIQAFTWGVNHVVAGVGMSNPWLYGLVSGGYAFTLGITDHRVARCLHHAAVEYFVIDNLIKPAGHDTWLAESVRRLSSAFL
mmetsp:Transcript_4877/g.8706  ORF Transcript_4877/g.8706 Transcript_4877/m.8706 type:complete len:340 (-) Transcript_4877:327-1346(-)|eukprot:CAMPEP_0197628306 /NCGR_PEP_ID=MMETSP1338-20131121/6667_1 /TAXON_ID=43686 ORGANISM="Pelagodinium beii, Strain RCC1491" /NCGR_SAMPLE_ID=MMETSP1338 /ASSEMBLY_ACC=CAM_ASM_000754 /LENGTH=339 /DNA_ID=CAMNT_0043199265 /DNA_START=65 /DNA_END=1084 /DNA_ORIENTATION=+